MIKWLAVALLVVLFQAFSLAALSDIYPYLTLIMVVIAVMRLDKWQSLSVALLIGLVLDSLSAHTFGLFMVIYLGVWILAGWLRQTGIVLSGFMGLSAALLLLLAWHALLILGAAVLQGSGLAVLELLPVFIGQYFVTLIFALPFKRLL